MKDRFEMESEEFAATEDAVLAVTGNGKFQFPGTKLTTNQIWLRIQMT